MYVFGRNTIKSFDNFSTTLHEYKEIVRMANLKTHLHSTFHSQDSTTWFLKYRNDDISRNDSSAFGCIAFYVNDFRSQMNFTHSYLDQEWLNSINSQVLIGFGHGYMREMVPGILLFIFNAEGESVNTYVKLSNYVGYSQAQQKYQTQFISIWNCFFVRKMQHGICRNNSIIHRFFVQFKVTCNES